MSLQDHRPPFVFVVLAIFVACAALYMALDLFIPDSLPTPAGVWHTKLTAPIPAYPSTNAR